MDISTLGIDLSKTTFHVIGFNARGEIVLRRKFSRKQLLQFTSNRQQMLIGMEACGGAHFLGRALRTQGHDARLMPPQFVKPFANRTRTTIWMRRRLPRRFNDQRCVLSRSRPTTS